MSVINDMLKDLEQRQYQRQAAVSDNPMQGLGSVAPLVGGRNHIGWLLGSLALAVCFWLIWRSGGEESPRMVSVPLSLPPELVRSVAIPEVVVAGEIDAHISTAVVPVQAVEEAAPPLESEIAEAANPLDEVLPVASGRLERTETSRPSVAESKPQIEAPPARPPAVKKTSQGYAAAEQALKRGDGTKAERLLKTLLAEEPEHLPASQLLSRLYLENNRYRLAESVALFALQYHPRQAELVGYLTRSLLGQGRLDAAADLLERNMQEQHAPHLWLMGLIRQRQERHAEASRYYRQALQLKPDETTWLIGLAISQEHLGETKAALAAYRRSLQAGGLNGTLQDFVTGRIRLLNGYE